MSPPNVVRIHVPKRFQSGRVWVISDTHERHRDLAVPDGCDIVIHCGDEANSSNPDLNFNESLLFMSWFSELPIARKIFVPGNHSTAIAYSRINVAAFREIEFLIHAQTEVLGMVCFGSPWTPDMPWENPWVYTRKRAKMYDTWESLPERVDFLVTHGPPKGIMDLTRDQFKSGFVQVGCKSLAGWVDRHQPLVHAFGHIHDEKDVRNYGCLQLSGTAFVNSSVCNLRGEPVNGGHVLQIIADQ